MFNIQLKTLNKNDSSELFQLINTNRDFLKQHLGWLYKNKSINDIENFISLKEKEEKENKSITYKIIYNTTIIGIIDFHDIKENEANIGYWLDKKQQRKGFMTESVKQLIYKGFYTYNFDKINIFCGIDNFKSQNIAKRLNFQYINTIANRENLYGKMVDNIHYQLLKKDYIK